jgi:small-conductance mechanosensitive channel
VIGSLWAMTALWYLNPAGYQWAMSTAGFILAFGFMFKDTFKRTFESFCFILAEHPYDVGDVVSIDNSLYTVVKIEIFTTIFRKEPDALITYIPNCILATKSIHNLQRSAMALDTLLLTLPASTSMSRIGELQGRVRDFLAQSVPTFTGHVQIVPFELKEQKMNVRVESRYQDEGVAGLSQKLSQKHTHEAEAQVARKNNLAHYLERLLAELGIA